MIRKHKISGAIVLIALGVFLRAYIAYVIRPVNGDSAVFALMAKHISELKEFYIYMPLAHYAGALSSYIAAAFFKGFGISYNSFITAGLIFSSAGLVAGCVLSRRILDGFGELISNLLIAAPSFLMIRYSLLTGVHAENVLFIPMLLLIAVKMNANGGKHSALFAGMSGFISGIALWATPSSVPAVLTIMTVLIIGRRREAFRGAALFLIGMLIGYAPGIIYDFQYPNASLFRMAGRILNLDRSALSAPGLPMLIFRQVCWRISTVPESICRIPRLTAELITFPGMLLFLASMIIVFAARLRGAMGRHRLDGMGVVLLYAVWFVIFYSFLVGEPAARYMIPLAIISPFMIGDALSGVSKFAGKLLIVILAAALVYINVMTVKNSAQAYSSERYMLLNEWLVKNDVTSGYSDYDTAYISEFLAFGKVMISPTLFSPTFADRWPDETNSVRNSTRVCYIIDSKRYGRMIEPFKNNLDRLGIVYRKYRVNDFEAYLDIPPAVQPDSIMPKMREDGRR